MIQISGAFLFAASLVMPGDSYLNLKPSCSETELVLATAVVISNRDKIEIAGQALRAELSHERPDLKEKINGEAFTIVREELIKDAFESDKLQYAETCRTPMLDRAAQAARMSGYDEIFRLNQIMVVNKQRSEELTND